MPSGAQITFAHVSPASPLEQGLYSWVILAMLGISSGILTMTGAYLPAIGFFLSNGILFGLALFTYFFLCRGYRSFSYAILLVILSVVAYTLAFWGAAFSSVFFRVSQTETPIASMFVGGVIGGFLLLTAVLFLFRSPGVPRSSLARKAAIWSLASGGLGALGWALGPSLGKALWSIFPTAALPSPDSFNQFSLYFVWQSLMALLVGFVVRSEQRESVPVTMSRPLQDAPQPGEPSLLTQKKFFTVVTLLLAVILVRAVPIRVSVAKREAGQARVRTEVPSMENLPIIQPMSVDEALINAPIAGYTPHQANSRPQMVSHEKGFLQPPGMDYAVTYYPEYDIPRPLQNSISVSVQQYPNSQWASYLAEFPYNIYNPYDNPKVHATVSRFQNKVRTNSFDLPTGTNGLYYMWSSGNNIVTLTYNTSDEKEDFLRLYLQKYPSSVR